MYLTGKTAKAELIVFRKHGDADVSTEIYLPQPPESFIGRHRLASEQSMPWPGSSEESNDRSFEETQSYRISPWCVSGWKRVFDLACVVPTLVLISPLLGIVALAVRLTSSGPIIFRQQRVGKHRKLFTIYKFRTMIENSEAIGPGLTATGDPRIIRIGHFLRRFKLDELPQLFNVLRGDMSLVGPRPKLPELELTAMPCCPGVTGAATLLFRKEQHILREVPRDQIGNFYSKYIAPTKVMLDATYMSSATFRSDLGILKATMAGGGQHVTRENLVIRNPGLTQSPIALERN
jgi:lipopolysaccharide/colanic/teichoic acid biosynthesis glycosyltransferase